ncbi:hypothetical protein ACJIZ3_013534 [Penstemon smallii]|uniref:Peroxidase n=1 Tax=Penstemon smallii TaxID=265156 RepID=A0ABD3RKH6_9LAMI
MNMINMEIFAVILFLCCKFRAEAEGLSYNFYDQSCPQVENIVRAGLQSASLIDPTTPSAVLRLLFHDCQVEGCDASILLDPDNIRTQYSEMASPKNFGIRKRELINNIKSNVEAICPQKVSCSDILVMAAREAVALSGGPRISVPLGRRDSNKAPDFKLADALLPSADFGVDSMLHLFSKKGLTVEESVAILGAHTLGITHCTNLQSRLYNSNNKATNLVHENILRMICPVGSSETTFVPNDLTSLLFDNHYFINTLRGHGVLKIDAEMPLDPRTGPYVKTFGDDQEAFFKAFSSAFVKISNSDVLIGNQGVIRRRCNERN